MLSNQTVNLKLAGIASILAGLIIITFAGLSSSPNIFLIPEVYSGTILPWIESVVQHSGTSNFVMLLPVFGFSLFLVVILVLYQFLPENNWQKTVSLAGFLIGVPVVVFTFAAHHSLINLLITVFENGIEPNSPLLGQATFILYLFMFVNEFVGPFFIIFLGTGLWCWAALKQGVLPLWICWWGIGVAILMGLSFLGFLISPLKVLGNVAPLHMLLYIVLGIHLLRISKVKSE